MPTRELVALALGPLVLASVYWLPAWVFLALLTVAVAIAGFELLTMARSAHLACGRWLPLLLLVALLLCSWRLGWDGLALASTATLVLLPATQLAHPQRPRGGLTGVAVSCFVVLFLGVGGACLGWLRLLPQGELGAKLTLFYLVCIWIGDSGAYYVGRGCGRHHMAPRISPKKTWEGLGGGTVATYAGAAALKLLFIGELSWPNVVGLATVLAIAAPVGDLVESHIKRETGVKDSSTLLLGHGGFLDRTDSVLYAAPPVLAYLMAVGIVG
jgi:phosphatidate cytidylyltransferase